MNSCQNLLKNIVGLLAVVLLISGCNDTAPENIEANYVDWRHHGNTHSEQRFSQLDQINTENVSQLGLAWAQDIPLARSLPATPLAVNGILYYSIDSGSVVYAIDGKTGEVKWHYTHKFESSDRMRSTMGAHRGVAFENGRIFYGTADGYLNALIADTGALLWSSYTFEDDKPRYISGAPRVFNGKVIIGHGGGDQGARGYVSTYDAKTGELVWRFYTVPGNPADGFENDAMAMAAETWTGEWWKLGGGGTVWNGMTYDPEFNRVYIGTSNGSPYSQTLRSPGGGDNLFLCSIVALDADTGEYIWHYQMNPAETWDYKAAMDILLADLTIDGQPRKVIMQAPTNGFFYVIDRETGNVISAEKWGGKVTWASHIDLKTGRPVEAENIRYENGPVEIWPGHNGAHNFQAMSYNPETGLAYIPHLEMGMIMDTVDKESWQLQQQILPKYSYALSSGATMAGYVDDSEHGGKGSLVAYDPVTQSEKWRVVNESYWNGGTMTTAGNLVFYGTALGEFAAYHAETGEQLWNFDAGLGIIAAPISYSIDGTQYVSLLVGYGASAALGLPAFEHGWKYAKQPRRLLTFSLNGDKVLPPTAQPDATVDPIVVEDFVPNPQLVEQGVMVYHMACAGCHGMMLNAEAVGPDLRESAAASNLGAFKAIVRNGVISKGMPEFNEFTGDQLEAMYHFIRAGALNAKAGVSADACEDCPVSL